MRKRRIRIGSRESKLAVVQSRLLMEGIKKCFPEYELELITMKTTGDKILEQTLDKIGGKGLFVRELDQALGSGTIDIAVHSLKDMPADISEEFTLAAFSKREDPRDVLVLPQGVQELAFTKPVGCSSARRKIQLQELFNRIEVEPVRGNVITRITKLDEGQFGALILAYAGLKRLGLENRISCIFSTEEIIPAAGQGILAVQGRKGEDLSFLDCIQDRDSYTAASAEREFIKRLNGGCSAPTAAFATVSGDEVKLTGFYMDEKSGIKAMGSNYGTRGEARKLGHDLAEVLLREAENGG